MGKKFLVGSSEGKRPLVRSRWRGRLILKCILKKQWVKDYENALNQRPFHSTQKVPSLWPLWVIFNTSFSHFCEVAFCAAAVKNPKSYFSYPMWGKSLRSILTLEKFLEVSEIIAHFREQSRLRFLTAAVFWNVTQCSTASIIRDLSESVFQFRLLTDT
jgi:hypothetical protein